MPQDLVHFVCIITQIQPWNLPQLIRKVILYVVIIPVIFPNMSVLIFIQARPVWEWHNSSVKLMIYMGLHPHTPYTAWNYSFMWFYPRLIIKKGHHLHSIRPIIILDFKLQSKCEIIIVIHIQLYGLQGAKNAKLAASSSIVSLRLWTKKR